MGSEAIFFPGDVIGVLVVRDPHLQALRIFVGLVLGLCHIRSVYDTPAVAGRVAL